MWQSLANRGHWEGEVWNRRKDGEIYAELLSISAVRDGSGPTLNYVALLTDISLQKRHEQELEHIAHYDTLTGLPNRALLADRLQQEMAHCLRRRKQLAVVFIDLDGFKLVNDQHGHGVGDELLIALALRMKGALREGDTLARIGGDEFVAVLTGLDLPKDCEVVLSRLLAAAAEPVMANGVLLRVSASIGVTLFPQDSGIADQLLRHADHAMYQAKQSGKNRYHYFDVKDDAEVKTHRESLEEISLGLDRDEFVLHYQPKVNMKTGVVVGMEALIRWQHPVRGLLPPSAFLPEVHGHSLSIKLGDWVIRSAVWQMAQWNAAGVTMAVSVNIDAMHLQDTGFVARLQEILAMHPDVRPRQLDLEVLETSALEDMDRVTVTMRECCALGVGFSLDDFGTGYSSLTYLKRLPAELMKIDQSFVIGMIADSDDFVIVEGVVGLAKAFGRAVLAEGVETIAHGKLLLALGCEMGQGYGIAHAMPAHAVAQWLKDWRPDPSWLLWNEPSLVENDRDLVLADVKHRHWIRDIENYVTGASETFPALGVQDCPLGLWLAASGHARYNQHPAFAAVIEAHDAVHAVAKRLVDWRRAGEHARAVGGLPELNVLRDSLIASMAELGVDSR
jgi:diguanylate cyclase (GGDEF)-like protein